MTIDLSSDFTGGRILDKSCRYRTVGVGGVYAGKGNHVALRDIRCGELLTTSYLSSGRMAPQMRVPALPRALAVDPRFIIRRIHSK